MEITTCLLNPAFADRGITTKEEFPEKSEAVFVHHNLPDCIGLYTPGNRLYDTYPNQSFAYRSILFTYKPLSLYA